MVEKFGTNGGKIWYLTSVDLMRAHARAHAHSNTSQTHAHSVGMCLGFYRPQKVLSWAENQNFKVAEIFGTFPSLFHGVQYCTIGLEKTSAAARPRALLIFPEIFLGRDCRGWDYMLLLPQVALK